MSEEPAARAVALVERLFALLHECRALVPQLEGAGSDPEPVSAQAERLLYYALVGALEAGLVRTAEDTLTVLRQASQPLGPMGAEGVDVDYAPSHRWKWPLSRWRSSWAKHAESFSAQTMMWRMV